MTSREAIEFLKNMIDSEAIIDSDTARYHVEALHMAIKSLATETVHCEECIHSCPISKNADLNYLSLLHCNVWRGELAENVWHKYKKEYKSYSIVEKDGYCDQGERKK